MARRAKAVEQELGMVQLRGARCRCGHEWLPRIRDEDGEVERPAVCPKCKSARWDKPRRDA
jgi:predicted Zn-ribbon and HTH transcriptional regulator